MSNGRNLDQKSWRPSPSPTPSPCPYGMKTKAWKCHRSCLQRPRSRKPRETGKPLPPPAHRDDQIFGVQWLRGLQGGYVCQMVQRALVEHLLCARYVVGTGDRAVSKARPSWRSHRALLREAEGEQTRKCYKCYNVGKDGGAWEVSIRGFGRCC